MATLDLKAVAQQTRYPLDAFLFVRRGLEYTVCREHGQPSAQEPASPAPENTHRHISGDVLCDGLREFALQEYGLLARMVLRHWRIHRCEDFGVIVFAMVDAGLMHKTDEDSLEDFRNLYDFGEAFGSGPRLSLPG